MPIYMDEGSAVPGSIHNGHGSVASSSSVASADKLLFLLSSIYQEMLLSLLSMGAALSPMGPLATKMS